MGGVSSFGVDADGELFALDYGGTIYRILPQDPPNLRVTTVTVPATGVAGGTISVTNRIRNAGGVTAVGPFRVGLYLSSGSGTPGAGIFLGSRTVTSLAGGLESPATTAVTVPPGTAPGLYFVSAVVDIDETVDESDEGDNGLTAATRVEIIRPDLAMLAVSGPTRGAVGKPISVSTSVKNVGALAAGAFTIGIYLAPTNTPGSRTRIATRSVASLAPGATTTAATSANIPPGTAQGPYFLSAVADDGQVVLETGDAANGTNGANNSATATGQLQVVSLLPDLEITSVTAPATMGLGRPMTVSFTVRNSGLTAAGAFRVRLYLAPASPPPDPGDGVDVGFRAVTSLAAGASLATTAVVTVPGNLSQTSYFVSAVADADGQVAEIVEGAAANGRVAAAATTLVRPDLVVSRLDVAGTAAARAARGGTLTLRNVTVKNTALTPGYAPASTLKFYLSGDAVLDAGDVELTPAVPVPALAPGASFAAVPTLTIPASVATGARFLIARANALGNVPESDSTNDTAAAPLEIGDFADLEITAVAGPAAAGTGLPMTVSFTTRNAGTAPVGSVPCEPVPGPGAEPAEPRTAARRRRRRRLQGFCPPWGRREPRFDARRHLAGEPRGRQLLPLRGRRRRQRHPRDRRQRWSRGQRPCRDQDDHRHTTRPHGERAHRADPCRAGRHRRRHRDGQEPGGGASNRTSLVAQVLSLRRSDVRQHGRGAVPRPRHPSTRPRRGVDGGHDAGHPRLGDDGQQVHPRARRCARSGHRRRRRANNVTARAIEIGDFADLQITAVAGPVAAGTGRPMTVSFTTRNAGVAPVGPFRVNLFLAPAPNPAPAAGDGIGVGLKDFPGLAAGASLASTLVVDLPASFTAGSYFVSAVADAGNAIPETGGNDGVALNGLVAAKTVTVIRPDLVVSALTGPVRAARGGTAAVTATVKNLAALAGDRAGLIAQVLSLRRSDARQPGTWSSHRSGSSPPSPRTGSRPRSRS